MSRVLVVDDEQSMRHMLAIALRQEGYEVVVASDGEAARKEIEAHPVEVVVSDIRMPGLDGIELLRFVRQHSPRTEVILMTAYTSTETAVEALRLGAYDYIGKPFEVDELKVTVGHAIERRTLRKENLYLRRELSDRHRLDKLLGRSPTMRQVFDLIQRVAESDITVLISGESGTGKELVARAIHNNGPRKKAPFITINCAAVPPQLLESELFGHVRGAFTGADRDKQGLFVAAAGGTLLLDEIGEMPLEMQPKLLRVLENHRVRPVGATKEAEVSVRVLAATNCDLQGAVEGGRFREDLYYRLNVIEVDVPPLRERVEDIPLLAEHFLEAAREHGSGNIEGFSVEAERLLEAYAWPGNVRELENAVRRAMTLESSNIIQPESLPDPVRAATRPAADGGREEEAALPSDGLDLDDHLEELKRAYMLQALEQTGGVQKRAAKLLGMSFRSFRYYLHKFDLRDGLAAGSREDSEAGPETGSEAHSEER
ncbi:MAG: sigma-54-dependent transcriptional regulator [Acidobacteriota bacterium]